MSVRLRRVAGLEGRCNDVVLAPPTAHTHDCTPHTLVYFGGDVQDYPEVMASHRDNRNYLRWNLESTARLLANCFPDMYILVVRPTRIEYKSFSCYDNFVPSNSAGVPDHTPTHGALPHLQKLLSNVSSRLKAMPASELLEAIAAVSLPEDIDIEDLHNATITKLCEAGRSNGATAARDEGGTNTPSPAHAPAPAPAPPQPEEDPLWWRRTPLDTGQLTLVGFSKGCVVLNQLIYEFHYTKTLTPGDRSMMRFMERIEAMYWLDGGHAGGKNTWITSRSLLETLVRLDMKVYVHVSPYQVLDPGRPWIGREEHAFTELLTKLGAKVQRYLHESPDGGADGGAGGAVPPSLHMHFQVLERFKRVQDSTPDGPALHQRSAVLTDSSDDETDAAASRDFD